MSTIVIDRKEWEQLLQDTERLVQNYEKLLEKAKSLEAEKAALEEKLKASQSQNQELQQKLSSLEKQVEIDSEGTVTIKELRSSMSKLLKESEKPKIDWRT